METFFNEMGAKAADFLPNFLTALGIFLVSLYFAGVLGKLVRRVLKNRGVDHEIGLLLSQLTRWSIIIFGIITALQRFFDVTAFLAGLGILGFTVGFALQEIMQNFVAGLILMIQQPFNVGDAAEVAGYAGTVEEIHIRTTQVKTLDGLIVIIPNASILSNPITNYTRAKRRRVTVEVGVGYSTNLDLVRATVLETIKSISGFVDEPAPAVITDTFGDSAINLTTHFWIDTQRVGFLDAKDEAVRQIKTAFDKAGIDIPFPIRTVYMQSEN